jgi:DNA topoisomerase I
LDQALFLLSLPKTIGKHPELKKDIKLGIGRFGPYVVCDGDYRSVPKTEDFFTVSLKRALELFAQPKKGRGRAQPLKELGNHPNTKDPIQLMNGKYGPYVKCGKINVSLPEDKKPDDVDLGLAITLLAAKMGDVKEPKTPRKAAKGAKKQPKSNTSSR